MYKVHNAHCIAPAAQYTRIHIQLYTVDQSQEPVAEPYREESVKQHNNPKEPPPRGKAEVQVEHIRLTLSWKHLVVNHLKVHPFQILWFQIVNLHPYTMAAKSKADKAVAA